MFLNATQLVEIETRPETGSYKWVKCFGQTLYSVVTHVLQGQM
jgi:hypothetical protein